MFLRKLPALPLLLCLVLAIALGYATTTLASGSTQSGTEADWKFHSIVDVNFVMQQVKVPMPEDVMIIDARPKRAKYDKGHIPGAISISDSKFDKLTDKLPKDKNALLIFYCGGAT
jgi:hypothetical protein